MTNLNELVNKYLKNCYRGVIPFFVGLNVGIIASAYVLDVNRVYLKDVDNDGRKDIVLEKEYGKDVFFQQENKLYRSISEIMNEKKEELDKKEEEFEYNYKGVSKKYDLLIDSLIRASHRINTEEK